MMTESTKRHYKNRLAGAEGLLEDERKNHAEIRQMCADLAQELEARETELAEARVCLSAYRGLMAELTRRPVARRVCKSELERARHIDASGGWA